MLEVNVTGVFMTAQAVAKQMIRFGNGGSIAMIASMSGTIANRVRSPFFPHPLSSLLYISQIFHSLVGGFAIFAPHLSSFFPTFSILGHVRHEL